MNELLVIVGVFVFFISVYGAVMIGGHLLEQIDGTPAHEPDSKDATPSTTPSAHS